MKAASRPIVLLADSRPLFASWPGGSLAADLLNGHGLAAAALPAAYIGAANGDDPQQYELFRQAMMGWGVGQTRQIPVQPNAADLAFLSRAELVLLSGGDVRLGLAALQANGVADMVRRRHRSGAVIIGVSAGAVQLGMGYWPETAAGVPGFAAAMRIVPYVVDVHDEPRWPRLQALSRAGLLPCRAYGIPSGAALLCGPGAIVSVRGCQPADIFTARATHDGKYKLQGDDHECT